MQWDWDRLHIGAIAPAGFKRGVFRALSPGLVRRTGPRAADVARYRSFASNASSRRDWATRGAPCRPESFSTSKVKYAGKA